VTDLAGSGAPRRYGTIVIVGGGCYGRYYARQIARAQNAGALSASRVVVVDRDAKCLAGQEPSDAELVVAAWDAFFDAYLGDAPRAGIPSRSDDDAIVPSPLMPHLMYEWLLRRARSRWPGRLVGTVPLPDDPPTPWHRSTPDGTAYASFATWTCPVNCIEPVRCPHTRGPRNWTMPAAAAAIVAAAPAGERLAGPVIFHCTHRAYGVGMFDTRDVVRADTFVTSAVEAAGTSVLVGTVSHCHGAFNVLRVGPASGERRTEER